MKSYIKIPQTKSNIYTSNTPRQYASVQIKERSNNINSVPIPQAKKNINNYPRKSYSTYSTTHDDNHSFYESKVDTPIGKNILKDQVILISNQNLKIIEKEK